MTGQGYVALDVAFFLCVAGAWLAHMWHLPACWRESRHLYWGSVLRMTGWICLSFRYWVTLILDGDILVPLAAEFAIMFVAVGDIWTAVARRKVKT